MGFTFKAFGLIKFRGSTRVLQRKIIASYARVITGSCLEICIEATIIGRPASPDYCNVDHMSQHQPNYLSPSRLEFSKVDKFPNRPLRVKVPFFTCSTISVLMARTLNPKPCKLLAWWFSFIADRGTDRPFQNASGKSRPGSKVHRKGCLG